ncbi:MAG: hypothetical protein Q4G52_10590 [Clostridia bacterium]|nr:hypothetical protein [Clostridia bacterium]
MTGFTDIHSHVIYGVDDGAQTEAEMEAMLDAAHAQGISTLFATSHVTPGVLPFDHALYEQHLMQARRYCRERGYGLTVQAGAEIMYTPAIRHYAAERLLPTLAGSDHILLEFVPDAAYQEIENAVGLAERSGYVVTLAHIERYDCLYRAQNAYRLKERHDVHYQVNCSTIVDGRGFWKDRQIRAWLRDEMIDFVASDAHNCIRRPFRMREAYTALEQRVGEEYAKWLTGLERSDMGWMSKGLHSEE